MEMLHWTKSKALIRFSSFVCLLDPNSAIPQPSIECSNNWPPENLQRFSNQDEEVTNDEARHLAEKLKA